MYCILDVEDVVELLIGLISVTALLAAMEKPAN
jgi:hypothetical protein